MRGAVKRAIRRYRTAFAAFTVLVLLCLGVVTYILAHQHLYLPGWVPLVGTDFYEVTADFAPAQAVASGQGQSVNIAGVRVGEIGQVKLHDGVARVSLRIKQKYAPIYRDASALLRPKTALKDMTVELDPGSPTSGALPEGGNLPVASTSPDINFDEVISALDSDTRDYLVMLLTGGSEALAGPGTPVQLRAALKRFAPTNRDLARITTLLAQRRVALRSLVHNLGGLTTEIGRHDRQLSQLVTTANGTFQALASQDTQLAESMRLLPGTLMTAHTSLVAAGRLAERLGPTLQALRPAARNLGPALVEARPFLRTTTPVIRDELRPFAVKAQPPVRTLERAVSDLRPELPQLTSSVKVVNTLLNELAYNPPGSEEGYLFWLAWGGHNAASLFSTQDAQGPIRRGLIITSCDSLNLLDNIAETNSQVRLLKALSNLPTTEQACAAAGLAKAGGR